MVMNISCKFGKASYIFLVRAVTAKSVYTHGGGGVTKSNPQYPPDTTKLHLMYPSNTNTNKRVKDAPKGGLNR